MRSDFSDDVGTVRAYLHYPVEYYPGGMNLREAEAALDRIATEAERLQAVLEEIGNDADAYSPLAIKARVALNQEEE